MKEKRNRSFRLDESEYRRGVHSRGREDRFPAQGFRTTDEVENALRAAGRALTPDPLTWPGPACPNEETARNFLLGRMRRQERRAMEDHLCECESCRRFLADVVRTGSSLDAPETRVPDPSVLKPGPPRSDLGGTVSPRPRRAWTWGFGVSAVVVSVALVLLVPAPNLTLVIHQGNSRPLRSNGSVVLDSGTTVPEGSRLWAEVTAQKDGYIYLYLRTNTHGEFLFPSPEIDQENQIRTGERVIIPKKGYWRIDDSKAGEETIYLLYSSRSIRPEELDEISSALQGRSLSPSGIKNELGRRFSIEQEFSYLRE